MCSFPLGKDSIEHAGDECLGCSVPAPNFSIVFSFYSHINRSASSAILFVLVLFQLRVSVVLVYCVLLSLWLIIF